MDVVISSPVEVMCGTKETYLSKLEKEEKKKIQHVKINVLIVDSEKYQRITVINYGSKKKRTYYVMHFPYSGYCSGCSIRNIEK